MTGIQCKLVGYIRDYSAENQRPPTAREMMIYMGFKSPRAVSYQLDRLVSQGEIIRKPGSRGVFIAHQTTFGDTAGINTNPKTEGQDTLCQPIP